MKRYDNLNLNYKNYSIDEVTRKMPLIGEEISGYIDSEVISVEKMQKTFKNDRDWQDTEDYEFYLVTVKHDEDEEDELVYAVEKDLTIDHKAYNTNIQVFLTDLTTFKNNYATIRITADDLAYYSSEYYDNEEDAMQGLIDDTIEELTEKFGEDVTKINGWESLKSTIRIYCNAIIGLNFNTEAI